MIVRKKGARRNFSSHAPFGTLRDKIIIALPIAYVLMNQWLQDYAYPITMDWWIFFMAILVPVPNFEIPI